MLNYVAYTVIVYWLSLRNIFDFVAVILAQVDTPTGLEDAVGYGAVGVIAILLLYWKRSDDKAHTEEIRKQGEEYIKRLSRHIEAKDKQQDRLIEVVSENTATLKQLIGLMEEADRLQELSEEVSALRKELRERS